MDKVKKHLFTAPVICMLAGISTAHADTAYVVPTPPAGAIQYLRRRR